MFLLSSHLPHSDLYAQTLDYSLKIFHFISNLIRSKWRLPVAHRVILNCSATIQGSRSSCFNLTFCHYLPLIPQAGPLCLICSEYSYFIISACTIIISHTWNDLSANHTGTCPSPPASHPQPSVFFLIPDTLLFNDRLASCCLSLYYHVYDDICFIYELVSWL